MPTLPTEYNARSVEAEALALWRARRLPPQGGMLGPPTGPALHQFAGAWTIGDLPSLVAHRSVTADVDARYLALAGRRAIGTLRQLSGPRESAPSGVPALLTALAVWTGGDGRSPWDAEERTPGVQAIVAQLATKGILVTRDESFRVCPTCGAPRSPERIVYDEEEGDTFLVRFPVALGGRAVNVLVWVDVPWKLLGTTALLLNPDLPYVVAEYVRRDARELVLTSAASLNRLRTWITDATFCVSEEKPGRDFQGVAYTYPLRHEFPMGGDLSPPGGTLLGAPDVGESGTGIVPLVPGHGPTDAQIAARFGVTGWPLITPKGRMDFTLMHKYAGLDLDTASEFVLRDLSEAGALLARLRVRRGVPHCALCGTALLWTPGRAWCLEPSRLPAERRALFSRLLPKEVLPGQAEVAPWPVSEATASAEGAAVALLECARCDRLAAPGGPPLCSCGGPRALVRRKLLPSSGAAFAAWARFDPFPEGDSVHLYVGHRRRVPAVIHHLAALSGVDGPVGEVGITILPTLAVSDLAELVAIHGADPVRAALVRSGLSESIAGRFSDRCRQEAARTARWWRISREVLSMSDPAMLATFARPIGGFLGELEVEDRAILARWERTRSQTLAHYDHWAPGLVHRHAFRFLDNDLVEYRDLVAPRLALAGTPTTKRAALRTLVHLLRGLSEVLAPILPFTSEGVHRAFSTERTSVFEQPMGGLDRSLLNDDLVAAWDRWRAVLRGVGRFRRYLGIPRSTVLPSVVLVLPADDIADKLRAEKGAIVRLARIERLLIGSPREPWSGRRRTVRPVEPEIQKSYPAQASQIIHLLHRMPARRWEATLGQEELTVVVDGLPRRVFPAMVVLSDTLPDRMSSVPWSMGEMYVEAPTGPPASRPSAPPLSADAYWLVRRMARRLRSAQVSPESRPRVAVVTAKSPLASELREAGAAVARYLGLAELRVVERTEEPRPPNAVTGRTRTGDRWWIHVPGLPPRRVRSKLPRTRARLARVSVSSPPAAVETDFADPAIVAHAESVRALGHELDDLLGLPLLGPAKIASAWEHGVHSVDDLRKTPYEIVAALPGFGGPVAEVVMTRLGGAVPTNGGRRLRRNPSVRTPPRGSAPMLTAGPSPTSSVTGIPALGVLDAGPSLPVPLPAPAIVLPRPPSNSPEPLAELPPSVPDTVVPEPAEPTFPPEVGGEDRTVVSPAVSGENVPEPTFDPTPLSPFEETAVSDRDSAPETEALGAPPPPEESTAAGVRTDSAPLHDRLSPFDQLTLPNPEEGPAADVPEPDEFAGIEETPALPSESIPDAPSPQEPFAGDEPAKDMSRSSGEPEEPTRGAHPDSVVIEAPAPPPADRNAPRWGPLETASLSPEPVVEPPAPSDAILSEAWAPTTPEPGVLPAVPEAAGVPEPTAPIEATIPVSEPSGSVEAETPPATPSPPASSLGAPALKESEAPAPPIVAAPTIAPAPSIEPHDGVVTLEAVPPLLTEPPTEPKPPSPPAGIELVIGDSLVAALGGFLDSTAAGHHGVCVVRESPERIRARIGSRPIEVFWLSNIGRGPSIRPSDLAAAWSFLAQKLRDEGVTAFFLEGIEYLVRLHGTDAVLNGLVEFGRLARQHDARIWICLTPDLMRPADLDQFRITFGHVTNLG